MSLYSKLISHVSLFWSSRLGGRKACAGAHKIVFGATVNTRPPFLQTVLRNAWYTANMRGWWPKWYAGKYIKICESNAGSWRHAGASKHPSQRHQSQYSSNTDNKPAENLLLENSCRWITRKKFQYICLTKSRQIEGLNDSSQCDNWCEKEKANIEEKNRTRTHTLHSPFWKLKHLHS